MGTCAGEILLINLNNLSVHIRIQAHAGMITGLLCQDEWIYSISEDGYANKIQVMKGQAVSGQSTCRYNRIVNALFLVEKKPYVSCYEIPNMVLEIV